MFLTLTQIMLFVLLIYVVWHTLFKPPARPAPPKPPEKKDPEVIIINKQPDKPSEGGGGNKGGKRKPREYLAWLGALILLLSIIWGFLTPNSPVMIELWSILSLPLKPLGLAILLLLFAVGEGIKNNGITKDAQKQIMSAFAILVIFSIPLVAFFLTQLTEEDAMMVLRSSMHRREPVDAIVLLGQATTQMSIFEPDQIHLSDTGDRIIQTAREYQHQRNLGNEPLVIVSAGPRPGLKVHSRQPIPPEADDIKKILQKLGIPGDDIIPERSGVDIRTSAEAVQKLVNQLDIFDKQVILVSSALNMQRARQTFRQLGIHTIPIPASFYTFQAGAIPKVQVYFSQKGTCDSASIIFRNARDLQFSDFVPSVEALLLSTRVINEFWSSLYYFLRGWLDTSVQPIPQGKDVGCY